MVLTKSIGLRIAALSVLQLFCGPAAGSENPGSPAIGEGLDSQKQIYQSRGDKVPSGYVIGRSLASYARALPAEFVASLSALGPADRWLDVGAGEGAAILDYCTPGGDVSLPGVPGRPEKKARAVAISIEDRRTPRWHQIAANLEADQIQYRFGRPLREYSGDELGRFQMITDVLGGFSYTENLTAFMQKTLAALDVNGSFYTLLQDVRAENGENRPHYPDASFLTEISNTDGSEVRVCSWLKSISCVEVTCELKSDWTPPIEVYRLRKVCDGVTVPQLLPFHYTSGTPPERRFRLTQ